MSYILYYVYIVEMSYKKKNCEDNCSFENQKVVTL